MTHSSTLPVVRAATAAVQDRARGPRAAGALLYLCLLALAARAPAVLAAEPGVGAARAAVPTEAPAWWPALDRPPLDPPLVVTGDFGEYRTGHFHAGLDFSTGGVTGKPVYACADGEIVRVRASGVGYGRSIYLQTPDGRLLVYGHLDAFDAPLAKYVAAVQESSGQYEQDLWPAAGAMPVTSGQRLGWTGNSGAGGPHFHFEIRRADMAYAPPRAGLTWNDTLPPRIDAVWLEPLDDTSYVERSPAPRRIALRPRPDTVLVQGRVRAVLDAYDPAESGDHMAAWSTEVEWQGVRTACVFDSMSWLDGMSEIDYVYDRGRATDLPRRALAPWASAGMRPRVIQSDAPLEQDAGTLTVRPGDPPRAAIFRARDVAGHVTERALVLRAPRVGERGVAGAERAPASAGTVESNTVRLDYDPLPFPYLRVSCSDVPKDARAVWFEVVAESLVRSSVSSTGTRTSESDLKTRRWRAVRDGHRWVAVLDVGAASRIPIRAVVERDHDVHWSATDSAWVVRTRPAGDGELAFRGNWPGLAEAQFEPFALILGGPPSALPAGLRSVGRGLVFGPTLEPLRKPFGVSLAVPSADSAERIGFYQDDGSGWSWLSSKREGGSLVASTRRLGSFAVAIDRTPPVVTPLRAPRRAARLPYSRWALEARASDGGSGVDARGSYFTVDGRRVPSEWDSEVGLLRWKPLAPPAKGAHIYQVVVADRAGNTRRSSSRFVID